MQFWIRVDIMLRSHVLGMEAFHQMWPEVGQQCILEKSQRVRQEGSTGSAGVLRSQHVPQESTLR